jgi:hypothetical protein
MQANASAPVFIATILIQFGNDSDADLSLVTAVLIRRFLRFVDEPFLIIHKCTVVTVAWGVFGMVEGSSLLATATRRNTSSK